VEFARILSNGLYIFWKFNTFWAKNLVGSEKGSNFAADFKNEGTKTLEYKVKSHLETDIIK
jgi:hypothetical protein